MTDEQRPAWIGAIAHIMAGYARWVAAGHEHNGEQAIQAAANVCLDAAQLCADLGHPVSWDDIGAHCWEPHPLSLLAMTLASMERGDEPLPGRILSIAEHLRSFYRDYPSSYKLLNAASQAGPSHKLTDAVLDLYEKRQAQR